MIENPTTQAEKDNNIILQYLQDNKLDFKSTESGIYYSIENEGQGGHPSSEHLVNTHYKGYLLDGKTFDSSYDRGEPIEFPLTAVIKGWQEAIPLLQKGGKGTFLIPSGIAYGKSGSGANIPPNTVLAFDVELLDFYRPEDKAKIQAEKDNKIILQYLEDNNLDFKSTESGIYYSIEKEGQGGHPTSEHIVNTHYKGYRLDGKTFDSSYERGEPIEFPLSGVIKGWQEAIPLLQKGGKGTFLIPSGIAYGARGAGADIPPNTVLAFDVELLNFYHPDEQAKMQAEKDEAKIVEFLKANNINAKRSDDGIYYTISKEGNGEHPSVSNKVTVHYEGKLLNGMVFDSSIKRGQPATFPLSGVVPGWQLGVPLLSKGGKGTLYIPSGLAYGSRGAGGSIPPNSVLIFDVELLEIQ